MSKVHAVPVSEWLSRAARRLSFPRLEPLPGRLLVASLSLTEPTLARTVVLLLDHDADGSLGLVLNRPSEWPADDPLPVWSDYLVGPPVVFNGGPVSPEGVLALGASTRVFGQDATEYEGFRPVTARLGLVDLNQQPEEVSEVVRAVRIFAGYAGWSPGQLDVEIVEGAWYVVEGLSGDAFSDDPTGLWRSVLRRQPSELAFLTNLPADVEDN